MSELPHPLIQTIQAHQSQLTPKGRLLGQYILASPRKVVFMTIKELAGYCRVSEATVVRFVNQLGFTGYSEFQQALRDVVDTELTLLERMDLTDVAAPNGELFRRIVFEEMDNLKKLHESLDLTAADRVADLLRQKKQIYVIGSRLSYTFAYYFGWSLSKIRPGVQIFRGSDNTTIDWLTIAPADSLVIMIATSRYPNDMIKIAKAVRRRELTLSVITDSTGCPLTQFAHEPLIAATRHIPLIGNLAALSCLLNFLIQLLASKLGEDTKTHQAILEKTYLENDLLFNLNS